ncbi:MAG TPA: sigma 54-interacting transcriptional regulator [Polyangiales bacterium]|nr:sigma 54-interacting transcriptional regulator [Polyangiales bacterium]
MKSSLPPRQLYVCVTGGANDYYCALGTAPVRIGSGPDNDLCIDDRHASRNHCEIFERDGQRWVRDLGSTNGTYLDGSVVGEAALGLDSKLRIGATELAVRELPRDADLAKLSFGQMVGYSSAIRQFFNVLRSVASTQLSCLLLGETGTGKELAARALHEHSTRARKPFIVVDCAAVGPQFIEDKLFGHERGAFTGASSAVPGVFEEARGGTVLLDEIGELPLELQAKLLGVLERREATRLGSNTPIKLDIRLISATHRDPSKMARLGQFRPDLLYRIAEITLRIPALRDRKEDIGVIAQEMLRRDGHACTLSADGLEYLEQQDWPGNIRELRNVMRRAASLAKDAMIDRNLLLSLDDVTSELPRVPTLERLATSLVPPPASWLPISENPPPPEFELPLEEATETFRKAYVRYLRRRFGDDLNRAAAHAGTHPKSVSRLFRLYRAY